MTSTIAQLDVDGLMSRLLNVGMVGGRLTTSVSEQELQQCCFISQSSLIECEPPLVKYSDLLRIFDKNGFPPETNYPFLGGYVERGRSYFMLRGNHECPATNRVYGFYEESNRRYKSARSWTTDQLRNLPRPQDPPNPSMGIDLLWADPDQWVKGWLSYVLGQDVVVETCQKLNIDLIARAHQVVQDGYEFFAFKKLVTIFSAPHCCGQFDNFAATMKVNEDLICNFVVNKPTSKAARVAAGNG
ncbi:unnamed protein product [Heligmosomoides polygyrus]|uniref:Serine/threonine-protein phosphatase n=1 Tax=Heligmosomoides polygyrus TaxID=6339 RepID=A0A183G0H6_HELPZ|nr:unnamed protein product [Heligmosomoides polygyrus]